jgi:hypothetical protein
MQSQLGMITPFFHKADGGMIEQAANPEQVGTPGQGPALKYRCMSCHKYLELDEVTDEKPGAAEAPPARPNTASEVAGQRSHLAPGAPPASTSYRAPASRTTTAAAESTPSPATDPGKKEDH